VLFCQLGHCPGEDRIDGLDHLVVGEPEEIPAFSLNRSYGTDFRCPREPFLALTAQCCLLGSVTHLHRYREELELQRQAHDKNQAHGQ